MISPVLLPARHVKIAAQPLQEICGGHMTHDEVAVRVRMLMRSDLDHEAVVNMARDRIVWLAARLKDSQEELDAAAEQRDVLSAKVLELEAAKSSSWVQEVSTLLQELASERTVLLKFSEEAIQRIQRLAKEAPAPTEHVWHPIETAPRDNKRRLYLAAFIDGKLIALDHNATWETESESWEMPQLYSYWSSENGLVEEPTHWAYQDGPPPIVQESA